MGTEATNRQLIEKFWIDLYNKDFDKVGSYFTDWGHYTDVGGPGDGATGPAAIAARLRLGLAPTSRMIHHLGHIVAQGDLVFTEHVEEWVFPTGEHVKHPFVSVHEIRDGMIVRWWDYSNLANLTGNAPAWWLEYILSGGTTPVPSGPA
jgi:limonene-1,2-epoxide hydrolase